MANVSAQDKKMKKTENGSFEEEIVIPQGVQLSFSGSSVTVEKSGKKLSKKFVFGTLVTKIENNVLKITSDKNTRREKKLFGTLNAILKNMFEGLNTQFTYKLKICSGHFPMNVSISGKEFIVKNFLGESVSRKVTLPQDATVKVEGDLVVVQAHDKEVAGRTAAMIEILTTIKGRDLRIFQDGIYIIQKHNKHI